MTDLKDVIWRIREKFPVDHAELLDLADRIEALTAENERLREAMVVMDNTVRELTEALTQIAEPCSVVVEPSGKAGEGWKKMYYAWRKIAVDRVDIARKALGDTHD